jgi:hypothetical protein
MSSSEGLAVIQVGVWTINASAKLNLQVGDLYSNCLGCGRWQARDDKGRRAVRHVCLVGDGVEKRKGINVGDEDKLTFY